MKKLSFIFIGLICISLASYAYNKNPRTNEITNFASGHSHDGVDTISGPSHSGGTERYNCHNASVPYHCH
jgi:hypothetical protein